MLLIAHKPINPGADIGVDLLISLLLAASIIFVIIGLANPWRSYGGIGIRTSVGKFELVVIACLIVML